MTTQVEDDEAAHRLDSTSRTGPDALYLLASDGELLAVLSRPPCRFTGCSVVVLIAFFNKWQ